MLEKIRNKYILIDTNIIIESVKHTNDFAGFYDELKRNNIRSGIDYAIKLEFLRSSNVFYHLKKKEEFLSLFFGSDRDRMELNILKETFIDARRISNLYYFLNIGRNVSVIDFLIMAQLKRYKNSGLFLATIDNKDFSTKIFDRMGIYIIDVADRIYNIGIYQFSNKKYNGFVKRFLAVGNKD